MKNEDPITIFKSENYTGNEKSESIYSVSDGRTGLEDLSFDRLRELNMLLSEYINREEKLYKS